MKFQVDSFVPLELSVFYRLALTSLVLFILCALTKKRLILTKKEIPFFIFIGFFTFCLNFLFGYKAVKYIPSGVIATIFSLSIIITEIISSFIDKRKTEKKIIISGLIGFTGLIFFILPMIEFNQSANLISTLIGLGLSLLLVVVYSVGNVLIRINREKNSTSLYTQIAYATLIGSLFMLLIILMEGQKFIFDFSPKYIFAMSYMVIFASLLAFICLFHLIHTIGAAKANYTALIYPVIALTISAFLENYQFSFYGVMGLILIISALAFQFLDIKYFRFLKNNA